jgi:hypothetical protein
MASAVVLGYLLVNPLVRSNQIAVGMILGVIMSPILLKWYHPLLICTWNAAIIFFFLPGRPNIVFLMSIAGFGVAALSRCLTDKARFHHDRWLTLAVLAFVGVVIFTAYNSGGIGVRSAGSSTFGGKKYFFIFGAAMGYFALVSRAVPRHRAMLYCGLFFLSSLTAILSYVIWTAGPGAFFLFAFFPPEMMGLQGIEGMGRGGMVRLPGLSSSAAACCFFLLLRFGIRGLLNSHKPWRGIAFLIFIAASLYGGFRSVLLLIGLTFVIQFYLEGLHRTKFLPILAGACIVVAAISLPFVKSMPLSVQRTLSVLPVLEVDPIAEADARESTEWRLDMWKRLWPMIPQYFWKGKGYSIDPVDLYFAHEGVRRGTLRNFEPALIAGEYHSGGLSVLIGFGILGLITFLMILAASIRVLIRHVRYGDPELRTINIFLLAHFIARTFSFFVVFGAVSSDSFMFLGIVGLGISINLSAKQKKAEEAESEAVQTNETVNDAEIVRSPEPIAVA